MAEPEPPYTAAEAARIAALLARGAAQVVRGRSTAEVERRIDALRAEAWRRVEAEERIRERQEAQRLQERAERRAARRWF